MPPTIKQVAEHAGVSTSTVSHVLNGTHYVSPELTSRVMQAVEFLDYQLNPVAQRLAGGCTRLIGLFVPELSVDNNYVVLMLRGINEALSAAEYDLIIHALHHKHANEAKGVQRLLKGMTDGLILLLPVNPKSYIDELHKRNFPFVVIDESGFDETSPTFAATNYQGAYDATQYLIDLGHCRIAFLAGKPYMRSAQDRLAGFKAAMQTNGLPVREEYIKEAHFYLEPAAQATRELLQLDELPTAIFAANDYSALGAMEALNETELHIPQDISLIGFDDIELAAYTTPRLTTVRQPLAEIGKQAAEYLLEAIANPGLDPRHIELPTELIIRDSCMPLVQPGE